jgi:beta-glucanase (GH16 family)
MWPYSYEACDLGTLKNQTLPNGTPSAALGRFGDWAFNYDLSWLPGQRLSSCTCPGEDHPGPQIGKGKWKARSAPEIDIFEAQVTEEPKESPLLGSVSQSCQFAPFNSFYSWDNITGAVVADPTQTVINGFKGTM